MRTVAASVVDPADLRSILESARWAASSYNEQPWRWIVATADEPAEHAEQATLSRAFLATAALQGVWAILVSRDAGRRLLTAGLVGTLGAIGVWFAARTSGISWFPGLELAEPIEWRDLVTQLFQVLVVAGCALVLLPRSWQEPRGERPMPAGAVVAMALVVLGILAATYVGTYGYVHGG